MSDNGPCATCAHPDAFHDPIGICHYENLDYSVCSCTCYEEGGSGV